MGRAKARPLCQTLGFMKLTDDFQKKVSWYFKYQKIQKIIFWLSITFVLFFLFCGFLLTNTYKTNGVLLSNPEFSQPSLISIIPSKNKIRYPRLLRHSYLCWVELSNKSRVEAFCENKSKFKLLDRVPVFVVVSFFGAVKSYYLSQGATTLTHHSSGTGENEHVLSQW